jgi:hypothetical protein
MCYRVYAGCFACTCLIDHNRLARSGVDRLSRACQRKPILNPVYRSATVRVQMIGTETKYK